MKNLQRILVCVGVLLGFAAFKGFAQAPEWEWAQSISKEEWGSRIAIDKNGNVYSISVFTDSINFGSKVLKSKGQSDVCILKQDSKGNVVWAYSIGEEGYEVIGSIAINDSGFIFITGRFTSTSLKIGITTLNRSNAANLFIAKYDSNGNLIWAKSAGNGATSHLASDDKGNLYITGNFLDSTISFDNILLKNAIRKNLNYYNPDIYIVKYDSDGNVVWGYSAGGTGGEFSNNISVDKEGNFYITGVFTSDSVRFEPYTLINKFIKSGASNIFVVKYNSQGNALWAKTAKSTVGYHSSHSIATDENGNSYITGYMECGTIIYDTLTLNNSILNTDDTNSRKIFVIKINSEGRGVWSRLAGNYGYTEGSDIATDKDGNVYVTGTFSSKSVSFESTTLSNVNPNTSDGVKIQGVTDIFIVKYDQNGNTLWAKSVGSIDNDKSFQIVSDAESNIYLSGYSFNSILFETVQSLQRGSFIAKLNNATTSISEITESEEVTISPNPTTAQLHISLPTPGNYTIAIYSLDGEKVHEAFLKESGTIDMSGKAKGAYVYRLLKDGDVFTTGKFVLE